jgi:hypothetical protein
MVKTLLAASLVYVYGHPWFDGLRPKKLEHSLQYFHAEVNAVALGGEQLLMGINDPQLRSYVRSYVTRVDGQIRRAN